VREQGECGKHGRRYEEGLRDRGVPDRLGVPLGAVVHEIEPGHGGQPDQAVREHGILHPGLQEARGLGTLARGDDRKHKSHHAGFAAFTRTHAGTKLHGVLLEVSYNCLDLVMLELSRRR
jgi:hypothetical protein